jgi:hypothetical protein
MRIRENDDGDQQGAGQERRGKRLEARGKRGKKGKGAKRGKRGQRPEAR